ncbi:MAG: hypothetical protein M3N49_12580, partial [Candidatus Eremiobacteraeota bacterium]|nr:hypothetical protein [Candidatus Eremiobacteraeota bacterium]
PRRAECGGGGEREKDVRARHRARMRLRASRRLPPVTARYAREAGVFRAIPRIRCAANAEK